MSISKNKLNQKANAERRALAAAKQAPLPVEEQHRRHLARLAREERVNAHVVVQYAQNGGWPLTRDELLNGPQPFKGGVIGIEAN